MPSSWTRACQRSVASLNSWPAGGGWGGGGRRGRTAGWGREDTALEGRGLCGPNCLRRILAGSWQKSKLTPTPTSFFFPRFLLFAHAWACDLTLTQLQWPVFPLQLLRLEVEAAQAPAQGGREGWGRRELLEGAEGIGQTPDGSPTMLPFLQSSLVFTACTLSPLKTHQRPTLNHSHRRVPAASEGRGG